MTRRLLTLPALFLFAPAAAAAQGTTPAEEAAAPDPPPPVGLTPATVRFASEAEGVGVRYLADPVLDDTAGGGLAVRLADPRRYALLCEAPCERELPRGHFALAFEREGSLRRMREPLGIDGPTAVRIHWDDHEDERLGGVVTLAAGTPVAVLAALIPSAVELSSGPAGAATIGGGVAGGVTLAAVLAVGLALLLSEDGARFSVTPLPDADAGLFSEDWR